MSVKNFIVIPAKNEAPRLGSVLEKLVARAYPNIIVVNDGSTDDTHRIAESYGVTVLKHHVNLGPGAATQTGIEYALEQGADYILTLDADGQHYPEDIDPMLSKINDSGVDLVIGSRFLDPANPVPKNRRLFNKIANILTAFLTGVHVTDSQSGMKVFSAEFARKLNFKFNGFEFCTELFRIAYQQQAKLLEVPIKVKYTEETMQKGQSLSNGFVMVFRLVRRYW